MEKKLILCKGNAFIPQRFWSWAVCLEKEYTDEMKAEGWSISTCRTYLQPNLLAFLDAKSE